MSARWSVQAHWWQNVWSKTDRKYHRAEMSTIPHPTSSRTAAFQLAASWVADPALIPAFPNNPSSELIEVHVLETDGRHVRTHRPTDRPLNADSGSDVHDGARSLADVRAANKNALGDNR